MVRLGKDGTEHESTDGTAGSREQTSRIKGVLHKDHKAQVEQAPVYHSVDSLNFTSSGGRKSDHEGSTIAESKGSCASRSKGKFTTPSSVPAVSACTSAAAPIQHTPAPSVREDKLRYWPAYESNGLVSGGSQSRRASSVLTTGTWDPPTNMIGSHLFHLPICTALLNQTCRRLLVLMYRARVVSTLSVIHTNIMCPHQLVDQKADTHLGGHIIMGAPRNMRCISGYNVMAVESHPLLGLATSLMCKFFKY
jgi:hypothetical protein